jgi:hypothetical protein
MNAVDTSAALQAAIRDYFRGEHSEMLLILAGSVVLAASATWLWLATRTSFSMAFMAMVLVAAGLLSTTAGSLLVRDKGLEAALTQGLASERREQVRKQELDRIEVVVSKYRYYRYGAAAIGTLGLLGLLLTHRAWVHGVAAGVMVLVAAQVVIDHFSENRARQYLGQLSSGVAHGPAPSATPPPR